MPVLVQVVLLLAALVLLVAVAVSIQFFRHPLATTVWLRRNRLRRAGFAKSSVETSVGPQIVWRGGSGPLLVLLHGAGDQAGSWHKVAADLARKYSLVIPDLAGHGESAPSSGPLSPGTILSTLEQVLDSTTLHDDKPTPGSMEVHGKPERFVLAGISLGAWIAMLYAHRHPERISRLLLIDGGALKFEQTGITLTPKNREEARRAFDAILDPSSPRPAAFVLDDLIRVTNRGPMARLMASEDEFSSYFLDDKLAGFSVPVDLIWGASDRLVPLEYARTLEAELPAARLTVLERCGHAPPLECPEKFFSALLSLLASDPPPDKRPAARMKISASAERSNAKPSAG